MLLPLAFLWRNRMRATTTDVTTSTLAVPIIIFLTSQHDHRYHHLWPCPSSPNMQPPSLHWYHHHHRPFHSTQFPFISFSWVFHKALFLLTSRLNCDWNLPCLSRIFTFSKWQIPCYSRIPSYWCRVKSGINTENSNTTDFGETQDIPASAC